MKEQCRDVGPWHWLDELVRDVRVGFRSLLRERLFAASVTLILALGIGTSVTMFSVLDAVVLRPLPYVHPNELVRLSTHLIRQDQFDGTSMANFLDWRQQSRTFASMTIYRRTSVSAVTFDGADTPQRAQEGLVGPEFFDLLGVTPLIGRTFTREEFDRGARVVVLSEGLWQEQFARSTSVLGQALRVSGESHVVIGVMPRAFQLPTSDTRMWRPCSLVVDWAKTRFVRDSDQFEVIGRLAPDIPLEDARAELAVIAASLRDAHPVNRNIDIRITSLFDHVVGARTRRGVWLGFAAVLSLLLIACANVGGLLSVRAAKRRRELAVRSALGAGRARLIRQLLAESVSVWAIATTAGLGLSSGLVRLLVLSGPQILPRMEDIRLDWVAVAVAFLGGLVVVVGCGTLPAFIAAKTDASSAVGTRDQTSPQRRQLQRWLVTAQIAGTVTLLVAAVLLAHSFIRAQREDPGYAADRLLIARVELPRETYPDRAAGAAFFRQAQERIGRLPGVIGVGAITDFFIRRNAGQWVLAESHAAEQQPDARLAIEAVTAGYFQTMGIDVLEGRDFQNGDYETGAPGVFIVSESLARRLWPGESAVGKRIVSGTTPPKDGRWSSVVGVVRDFRRESLDVSPILLAFVPGFPRPMDLTIRTATAPSGLIPAVRREIQAIDRALPLTSIVPADQRLAERIGGRRFETQVIGLFAAIAVLLSAAGVYAVLAYQVALRSREIGIRTALGAHRRSIVVMVLEEGVRFALLGATLGIAGAIAVARVLQSQLYETSAVDVRSYAAVVGFVLLVAVAAASVPARRAAGVSPMTALREG